MVMIFIFLVVGKRGELTQASSRKKLAIFFIGIPHVRRPEF